MPKVLAALAFIGTAAMLWVGGQIVVHSLGAHPAKWLDLHHGFVAWLADVVICGLIGLALGALIAGALHLVKPAKK